MSATNTYVVYETTNLINGKFYIGVHKTNGISYLGSGILLNKAIKKYGRDNFMNEILYEFDNRHEAYCCEISIVSTDLVKNNNCYNICEGGYGGNLLIGEEHHQYNRPRSDETKRKISISLTGIQQSKETRHKRSISNSGKNNYKSKIWIIHGKLFYSVSEASLFFSVGKTTIQRWCNPRSKYHIPLCYSKIWK